MKGIEANVPYSLSRWTDVPSAKWAWFREALAAGEMLAFDPRTAIPSVWSLKPEDTLGLNFWTKDPTNLIRDRELLRPYKVQVHMTITGWEEVERGVPSLEKAVGLLLDAAKAFGPENVIWRFSPVPMVPDVVTRFAKVAHGARMAGVDRTYVAFLQENDLLPETRSEAERLVLLTRFAAKAEPYGIRVLLCNDDKRLLERYPPHLAPKPLTNLSVGVCVPPEDWGLAVPVDGCGCVTMVDPFTFNESCTFGCAYCYAADKSLSPKKRNTSRSLPIVP